MKRLTLLSLLLLLISCATRMMEPPEYLIEESVFADILYDIALLKAVHSTSPATLENQGILIMPYVLEKYQIDSVQLLNSNKYYSTLGTTYLALFDSIEARLEQKSDLIDSLRRLEDAKPQRF